MFAEEINDEELRLTGSVEELELFMSFFHGSNIGGFKLYGPFRQQTSSDMAIDIIAQPSTPLHEIDDKLVYDDIFS